MQSNELMPSHEELHARTLNAARREKSATLELLRFLELIERRRTFAVLSYPSLFKYVEEGLGYSPAQASERVSAMRLLKQVPEVAQALETSAHTLTSIAKIASHARRENLEPEAASALVLETMNQPIVCVEKHLAGVAETELPKLERAKVISKALTRLTLDVEDEFMTLVQRMRELKGNPALSLSEVFESAMKEFIGKRELKAHTVKSSCEKSGDSKENHSSTSVAEVEMTKEEPRNEKLGNEEPGNEESKRTALKASQPKKANARRRPQGTTTFTPRRPSAPHPNRTRYIRVRDREITRTRAHDRCEYVHEKTQKRCDSRMGLQFEHVKPFAQGGMNEARNLKLYCPAHNRLSAIQAYGEKKMRPFLKY